MKDNLDTVEQRMVSIAAQFDLVHNEISSWDATYKENEPFGIFQKCVYFE